MSLKSKVLLIGSVALLLVGFVVSTEVCLTGWMRWGLRVRVCPEGGIRPVAWVSASGLQRGSAGQVTLGARAHYAVEGDAGVRTAPLRRIEPSLALIDPTGRETPLEPKRGWSDGVSRSGAITLPDVADGDYLLRARIQTPAGEATAEARLPLYAPARVHVLTDRPLYEPGNTVRFRAVVLRANDLAPVDGRPGVWKVTDPNGELLLEEKAPAGAWGVAAGSFPLDSGAASGTWRVAWESGGAREEASFSVKPFTLPRFRITASADKPFFGPGGRPKLAGEVVYSSGAPVTDASVELQWTCSGEWPLPTAWLEGALPKSAQTDREGRFELSLPQIPADLRGQVTLHAQLAAIDPAGDRVEGSASVLLSQDAIKVAAVTELAGGLVGGFNNRLFLRVTSADGVPLPGAELAVRRAWEPASAAIAAVADEDGVATLQLDPGTPVNVVIPPMPVRLPPSSPPVALASAEELLTGREPELKELRALQEWLPSLQPCARFSEGEEVGLMLRVRASGELSGIQSDRSALARCIEGALRSKRLPAGEERFLSLEYSVADADLPSLEPQLALVADSEEGEGWGGIWTERARDARSCLRKDAPEGQLPEFLTFQIRRGEKRPSQLWTKDPGVDAAPGLPMACIKERFAGAELSEPAKNDALAYLRLSITAPPSVEAARPQATVMLGYELAIAARLKGEPVGNTKLLLRPGAIPPLRLRASPVLAEAGGKVSIELLRGPDYGGELPKKLAMRIGRRSIGADVDEKSRTAVFELPAGAQGWVEVETSGVRATIWIRPKRQLEIALAPEAPHYAPGQLATLNLKTTLGGEAAPAAVGLFGVDDSLSQLAPLPGADELARLAPQAQVSSPAFDALDAQALSMGRIRGAHAATATVLRVSQLPPLEPPDQPVSSHGEGAFDAVAELTDRFYVVLAELHREARSWEEKAPQAEKMRPETLAKLWDAALTATEAKGQSTADAFGRRLRLSQLPPDLLALTDPREVVVEGTRLPEDIENWAAWVAREKP